MIKQRAEKTMFVEVKENELAVMIPTAFDPGAPMPPNVRKIVNAMESIHYVPTFVGDGMNNTLVLWFIKGAN